ncbi:MAG: TonB-dependent receptor [Bacteroidetes bacterium]|nr:TonB-dependent receptor [Bacteroidota bacterium]
MKHKLLFISSFLLLTVYYTMAQRPQGGNSGSMPQEGIITGKIIDADLNQPMEYANVVLFQKRDSSMVTGTVTNADGVFKLENLPFGMYYLKANFIGYEKIIIKNIKIYPKQKSINLSTIKLKQSSENLKGVEIVADRSLIEYKIDKKVINVSQDINSAGGSAIEALENTPSVNVDIEGNVSLRGSSNFTVLIDGRPSVLEGSDALQQIPANTIEQIEIITNPSAKYDPDGIAGIINVILKKQIKPGFNGIVNASVATGNKYSSDFLLNYRTGKINLFGGMDYYKREMKVTGQWEQQTYSRDTTAYLISDIERMKIPDGYSFNAGLDYYPDKKSTLSFFGKYGYYKFGRDFNSNLHSYTFPESSDIYSIAKSSMKREGNYYNVTTNFIHKFSDNGHELSAMAYYSKRKSDITENMDEYISNNDWIIIDDNPSSIMTEEDGNSWDLRVKADYSKPIRTEGRIEAGYQSRMNYKNNKYKYNEFDAGQNIWVNNKEDNNEMDFTRNIHSLYFIFSDNIKKVHYQLGLRGEYTYRNIKNEQSPDAYIINRIDMFPTIHISHQFPNDHQLMASYSRRINRPRGRYLDPFPNYLNTYNIRIGNPDLQPEYIDSYELGYQKMIKSSFISVEAYYRITNDKITRIRTLHEKDVMMITFENLDKDYALGTEIMANLYATKWLQINASINLYNYRLEGEIINADVNKNSTNFDGRLNTIFKFNKSARLQIVGFYKGPSVTAQGKREDFFAANIALRKDFFNRNLTTTLKVSDIFGTMKFDYITSGEGFYSCNNFKRESQIVTLSLSYRINNYKNEKQRDKETDIDFEEDF